MYKKNLTKKQTQNFQNPKSLQKFYVKTESKTSKITNNKKVRGYKKNSSKLVALFHKTQKNKIG